MTLNFDRKLFYLFLVLVILQLAVTLLTYGFALYVDEAVWHYIGRNWFRHGLVPYKGGYDNKTPLIFLIYGISDRLFGVNYWFPRVVGTLVQSVGIWYLYRIALHLGGRRTGILAVSMYGLSVLWQSTNGRFASMTETYEVACVIISVYFFLKAKRGTDYFISGLLAGLGFAFRFTAVGALLTLLLFSLRRGWRSTLYLGAGLMTCLGVLAGAAWLAGIDLGELWNFTFADNFRPGSILNRDPTRFIELFMKGFFHSELILFYPTLVAWFLIKKRIDLLGGWLLGGCLCICALGVFAEAHFKDILPPLSLIGALTIGQLLEKYGLSFRKTLAVIWICFFPKSAEPILCIRNMLVPAVVTSHSCRPPYSPLDNYSRKQLGLWIKANTGIHDKVYVANYAPAILVYTERLCPSIYFTTTETEKAKKTFYREMNENKPDLVAVPLCADYNTNVSAEQRTFIQNFVSSSDYRADTCLYNHMIYRINKRR